jgi:hypoxanthine phosphoribosyltransferase
MRLKFSVKTLDSIGLKKASEELRALVAKDFAAQLLIGIRTGGFVVAEAFSQATQPIPLVPITCRRPSTGKKQKSSLLKKIVLRAPTCINNQLRIAEHIYLTQVKTPSLREVTFDESELALIKQMGANKILIIDDSVDSGGTLKAVYDAVKLACPNANIKTATITTTTEKPLIQPDYCLYHYVLCRFPWSLDFKR